MKAFVIYLPEAPKKAVLVCDIVEQLVDFGLEAEAFAGINGKLAQDLVQQNNLKLWPYSLKGNQIDELDTDWRKLSRPGVMGCFLSHYTLWQRCVELNEPIAIFEDDVKLYRAWNPIEWNDVLILSLGKKSAVQPPWQTYLEDPTGVPRATTWKSRSMPGTSGYAIKPKAAQKLINTYRGHWTASDNAINCSVCNLQITNYIMGRHMTHDEGNVSLTKRSWS